MQKLYNTIVQRMTAQGALASGDIGCRYRMPDGRACAVGCLLDDATAARWDAEAGGLGFSFFHDPRPETFIEDLAANDINMDSLTIEFLASMQAAHDVATDIPGFLAIAAGVASRFGLQP